MNLHSFPLPIEIFRVGPRNRRLDDPAGTGEPSGFSVLVESTIPPHELMLRHGVTAARGDFGFTAAHFPYAPERVEVRKFELFDFSSRAVYGRNRVDESFVRDKLDYFGFRPATLSELICFAGHIRGAGEGEEFEAVKIVALGSVLATTEIVRKTGWFRRASLTNYRHYPQLECGAGNARDVISLSRTRGNRDGNWPSETLFLAAPLD
jgi:hypothetical protein